MPDRIPSLEESYLGRKAEVTEQDHKEFLRCQKEKAPQEQSEPVRQSTAEKARPAPKVNRRNFLKPFDIPDEAILKRMKLTGKPPVWIPMPPH